MRETISWQIVRSRNTYFFCRLILLSVLIALVAFTLLPFTVKTSGHHERKRTTSPGRQELPPEGVAPVAHWKFDDGTGNKAQDSVGPGNLGTLQGATWIPGHAGPFALSFDGIDDRVTVAPNQNLTAIANNFTVAFWVKRHTNTDPTHFRN